MARLNDGRGLRGSRNQRVHFLTDRLRGADLEASPRRAEVRGGGRELMIIGVPPRGLTAAVTRAERRVRQAQMRESGRHVTPTVGGGSE